jgi:hypothetical protein
MHNNLNSAPVPETMPSFYTYGGFNSLVTLVFSYLSDDFVGEITEQFVEYISNNSTLCKRLITRHPARSGLHLNFDYVT